MKEKTTEIYVRLLLSKNLKRFRSLKNMSQLDLALGSSLSHNYINEIENGKKWPSAKTIAKLCVILQIEPHQFFLTEDMINNGTQLYINDLTDSIQWAVKDVTNQYKKKIDNSGQ